MNHYPRGQLTPDDEGETELAIGVENNTVIIVFKKPTKWIGLDYATAVAMAEAILKRAEEIKS